MENPVSSIKSAFNVSFLLKFMAGLFLANVVLDLTGLSDYFYYPVATLKAKFGNNG